MTKSQIENYISNINISLGQIRADMMTLAAANIELLEKTPGASGQEDVSALDPLDVVYKVVGYRETTRVRA